MVNTLNPLHVDLAGKKYSNPHYFQIQHRITSLINNYLTIEKLNHRLEDLPLQFENPRSRPWKKIDWSSINREQVISINLEVFLSILVGAIDTEAPIRDYTQTSRQYLEKIHPQMARFVGGFTNEDGNIQEVGLWEKEERQHTPALIKVYSQLKGEKITVKLRTVRGYIPTDDPHEDLYRHGLHRVATEYGAACLYLWLMAHTTGALQDVFEQLLIDEINHMTKFWGFGVWLFPDISFLNVGNILVKTRSQDYKCNSLLRTLKRMMEKLNWKSWTLTNKATLIFTFIYTMHRLMAWTNSLTPDYLQELLGKQQSLSILNP